ncbi:MAG: sigma-54 dependent transcriptional regulator [Gemmatimonadota bacterium]
MKLLIVDDEPGLRQSLRLILSDEQYEVADASDGAAALARAAAEPFDLILCDVRMPAMDGLEFLRQYRAAGGTAPVIMMSAYGNEDAAIAAMKEGAYDYIAKPFRADEVVLVLRKAEEREQLRREVESLRSALGPGAASPHIVAESPAMKAALDIIAKVAPHRTTVLITGPSGTGKEVLARELHRLSPRVEQPFVAVNCAAIPEALLESELFGHVRGSFTGAVSDHRGLFEQASGGTLFLDEIGDLPTPLQAKLLRVLQDGEVRRVGDRSSRRVDARVVAATARDLETDVATGRFREDLFYRLNVVAVRLPPLAERPEDVPLLIRALLERHSARLRCPVPVIEPEAHRAMLDHAWPGNVRELENALERAMVLVRGGVIRRSDLPHSVRDSVALDSAAPALRAQGRIAADLSLKKHAGAAEGEAIRAALQRTDGNRREAAALLGISVRTLFYKLKELGITET